MSSVTSFIRQIPLATTYYTCASGTALYTFIATAANQFPGNYPNGVGYMSSTTTAVADNGQLFRDMGKTVKATVGIPDASGTTGPFFFREVQQLAPGTTQNSLSTFGVYGTPSSPSVQGYNTYYVPVSIGGSDMPSGVVASPLYPVAGGQM